MVMEWTLVGFVVTLAVLCLMEAVTEKARSK